MAVFTHAVTIADTTDGALFTSGSFTPAAGDLLIVSVRSQGSLLTPVVTGSAGLTFTLGRGSSTSTFLFIADQLTTAVPQTVTIDFTGDDATSVVASVERLSGMVLAGSAALKQAGDTAAGAGTTPAISFAAVPALTNPIIAFLGGTVNPPNVTPPDGFSEQVDTGIGTPTLGLELATRDSGHSSATVTWGGASAGTWRGIIAEFNAPVPVDQSQTKYGGGAEADIAEYHSRRRARLKEIEVREKEAQRIKEQLAEAQRTEAKKAKARKQAEKQARAVKAGRDVLVSKVARFEMRLAETEVQIEKAMTELRGLEESIAAYETMIVDRRKKLMLVALAAA